MAEPAPPLTGVVAPRLHLTHVEGIRALAALTVYVNHAYAQAWNPLYEYPSGLFSLFSYSLQAGHLAVTVFIAVSGFCLTLPVVDAGDQLKRGAFEFFKRRARRILPPYYGALALALLLIATVIGEPTRTIWDVPLGLDWVAVVSHSLLLQDFFGTGKINYAFWSIATEWHIYFLFPLFVWGVRRYGVLPVTIAAMLAGYLIRFGFDGTRIVRGSPQYLGMFALGMLAAYVVRSPKPAFQRARAWRWGIFALLNLAVVLVLCVHWGYRAPEPYFPYLDLPMGLIAMSILIYSTVNPNSLLTNLLNVKPIVFIGTFSYSVYLLHAPLLQLLWQYVLSPLGLDHGSIFVALLTGGALMTLLVSYGFFKVCEEPFMTKQSVEKERKRIGTAPVTP